MFMDDPFLRTILDAPDDDGPRLVYADWLDERGECDRAELIRIQCAGEADERGRDLVHKHGAAWAGVAARHAYCFVFRRGFVEELTVSGSALLEHGREIFAFAPVRLLRIIGARAVLGRLVESPLLARLDALHLTGAHLGDDGAELVANCTYLANLHTLRLGSNAIGDRGTEALADSTTLAALRTLVLHDNLIGDAGAQILATARGLRELRCLDLCANLIGDAGAEALAHSSKFGRLSFLDMSNQFKGFAAGPIMRGRPYPIQPQQQQALVERYGAEACVF